jgi:hypothetical protein
LINLKREDKFRRAAEILSNSEFKQDLCHQIAGLSHRDIDKIMHDLLDGRQLDHVQDEEPKQEEEATVAVREVVRSKVLWLLDQDEVNRLIQASEESIADVILDTATPAAQYGTYTEEEVYALLNDTYDPRRFPR